ncbi:uncharacterized protein LOC128513823 [Clarias gariepinus]|uniref:uncharacterized protein LOC128513823 n=1 Tax=Clarias gariepinus TaxID=13013 RepID=UPI00234D5C0D|nr:uncharacterized protein LOC128513823 [Clarias gariepinus]
MESFLLSEKDLGVSLIRLSGNGTLKQGDSLNLTCDVNCTHSSSQFVWSKNNEQLNTSGPVLHFPALTVRDSGNYTCTWKTKETSGSKTISLQVEGDNPDRLPVLIIAVTVGVIFIILVMLGAGIYNRRKKDGALYDTIVKAGEQTKVWCSMWVKQAPHPKEVSQQEEVEYASVCIKDNNLNNGKKDDVPYDNIVKVREQTKLHEPELIRHSMQQQAEAAYASVFKVKKKDDAPDDNIVKAGEQTEVKQAPHPKEVSQQEEVEYASVCMEDNNLNKGKKDDAPYDTIVKAAEQTKVKEEVAYASVFKVIKKKDDAPEDNIVKAGEQTEVKQAPQPKEVSQQEEVEYASVCIKDNNLNNGKKDDAPYDTIVKAAEQTKVKQAPQPKEVSQHEEVAYVSLFEVIKKKDDAPEDNIVKAGEQTEVKQAPQPKEVSQHEEVAYASLFEVIKKKDDAPEDNIVKAGEQTEVKQAPQPKEVSQHEEVAYVSLLEVIKKKDDAPEDNIVKAGEQTEVKQAPHPKEVSQQEEVEYASVCIKDNNLNNGHDHTEQENVDKSVIYSTVVNQ